MDGDNWLFLFVGLDVTFIAPEPISNTKPIVNTIKNIKATEKPNILTWYNVTAIGNRSNIGISRG